MSAAWRRLVFVLGARAFFAFAYQRRNANQSTVPYEAAGRLADARGGKHDGTARHPSDWPRLGQ